MQTLIIILWSLLSVVQASLLLTATNTTYQTINIFSAAGSFSLDQFNATVVPIAFDLTVTTCQLAQPTPTVNVTGRVLFLINWPNSAKPAGCRGYDAANSALSQLNVPNSFPLVFGNMPSMSDSAGPYVYVGSTEQALAIEPAGGEALAALFKTTGRYPIVSVQQEPGPWNLLVSSIGWIAGRWLFFTIIFCLELLAVYRITTLCRFLFHKKKARKMGKKLSVAFTNPYFRVYLIEMVIIGIGFGALNERARSVWLQLVGSFQWVCNYLIFCVFYLAWYKLAYKIHPRKRYSVFRIVTFVIVGTTLLGFVLILIGTVAPVLVRVYNMGINLSLAGVTGMLLLQQIFFTVLTVAFILFLKKHSIRPGIIRQFQKMILVGFVFLTGLIVRTVIGTIAYATDSTTQYALMILFGRVSIVIIQLTILVIPNTADIGWGSTEDDQIGRGTLSNTTRLESTVSVAEQDSLPLTSIGVSDHSQSHFVDTKLTASLKQSVQE